MQLLYRFLVLYFGVYFFPFPLSVVSGLTVMPAPLRWIGEAAASVEGFVQMGFNALAMWVGEEVLRLGRAAVVIQPTGSGDTLAAYIQTLCIFTVAVIGALLWSLWGRGRPVPPRLSNAFRVYVRYALAAILLSYGFAKVPPTQFQPPGPEALVRTYGDSSPMGLLWTFMGFSPAYTMFAGLMEIIPGLLLLFRQTATLGVLIGVGTMTNVVVLNFCYDVPVKLFSVHLLVALLVIAAPDVRRLLDFFVFNRPVGAAVLRSPDTPARRGWMVALKAAFVIVLLAGQIVGGYRAWYSYGPGAPRPSIAGVYEVESFSLDGEARPALWTDTVRWRRLLIPRHARFVVVQRMGGTDERFSLKHDEKAGAFVLGAIGQSDTFTLSRTLPDATRLVLEGPFRGGRIKAELKKVVDATFPVNTRGFRWIQELPYNR
jgi:hypothetical protein